MENTVPEKLLHILDNLREEELKHFHFHLQYGPGGGFQPIQRSQLEGANRTRTVELMVDAYTTAHVMEVAKLILDKMNKGSHSAQASKSCISQDVVRSKDNKSKLQSLPPDEHLFSVRKQFVDKVSDSTLNQLLDSLLQKSVINMGELEALKTKPRRDRAGELIDMVRGKGKEASSFMINALRELDPYLCGTLDHSKGAA